MATAKAQTLLYAMKEDSDLKFYHGGCELRVFWILHCYGYHIGGMNCMETKKSIEDMTVLSTGFILLLSGGGGYSLV